MPGYFQKSFQDIKDIKPYAIKPNSPKIVIPAQMENYCHLFLESVLRFLKRRTPKNFFFSNKTEQKTVAKVYLGTVGLQGFRFRQQGRFTWLIPFRSRKS